MVAASLSLFGWFLVVHLTCLAAVLVWTLLEVCTQREAPGTAPQEAPRPRSRPWPAYDVLVAVALVAIITLNLKWTDPRSDLVVVVTAAEAAAMVVAFDRHQRNRQRTR